MKERMKKLRRDLNLTQEGFAAAIGIPRASIANYESGKREPVSAVVTAICKTFGVSERWLRTGEGEMFTEDAETVQFKNLIDETFPDESKDFRRRVFLTFGGLSDEQWDTLGSIVVGLVKEQGDGMSDTAREILAQIGQDKEGSA